MRFFLSLTLILLSSCLDLGSPKKKSRPLVLTTTSLLSDLVREIAGDQVEVQSLMRAGVDPHIYVPGAQDISRIAQADYLFFHGLHLEGKMASVLEQQVMEGKKAIALSESIPENQRLAVVVDSRKEGTPANMGLYDPHIWMDLSLWEKTLHPIERSLVALIPEKEGEFRQRRETLSKKMLTLHEEIKNKMKEIPQTKRVLVTSHDAFSYFGRAYGLTVLPLQGISTATELSLGQIQQVSTEIKKLGVRVLFVESSVSPKTIQRLAALTGAKIGAELFSDSLGAKGQVLKGFKVDTYIGMMSYNATVIAESLKESL